MSNVVYTSFKRDIMDGTIDLDTHAIWVMLIDATGVAAVDTTGDHFRDDVTDDECTGTGYTLGGAQITSLAVTEDNTGNEGEFDGADVTWGTSTITARGAIVYVSTGTVTEDPLICMFDFGADKSSSAGDFKIEWNSEGILNLG
jgi:hypothetical protein